MAAPSKKEEGKKVRRPTALKRDIQSKKRQMRNRVFKSQMRTVLRSYRELAATGSKQGKELLSEVYSILDKGVKKGIVKLGTASRLKARLFAKLPA